MQIGGVGLEGLISSRPAAWAKPHVFPIPCVPLVGWISFEFHRFSPHHRDSKAPLPTQRQGSRSLQNTSASNRMTTYSRHEFGLSEFAS